MQGKPRELQADDDAKAAAHMWASEAAFGNTEVAAPKILGDIVESLVGLSTLTATATLTEPGR